MSLPTAYLTSQKNLEGIFSAILGAQAPDKFTQKFLEGLGYKSSSDRLIINVLKTIGFLDDAGRPVDRYFRYLDQTQSAKVLAEGVQDAYADLFKVNRKAQEMSNTDIVNKLKTLSEGKLSDSVAKKMAMTFLSLSKFADFNSTASASQGSNDSSDKVTGAKLDDAIEEAFDTKLKIGGLVYNIQIVLPESRDPAVYDALFRSLRRHLS